MNNLTKVLIAIFLIIIAAGIILAGINFYAVDEYLDDGYAEQEVTVWGNDSLDAFVSESENYEEHFVFSYIPRDPNATLDCYMIYEFKQDGITLESADKKLYEGVTASDPIVLEFPRVEDSTYELDVTIEDTYGVILHKSGMKVYPQKEGNESEV
ncbi:hypothetical protein MSMTP_1688 [Methanosarcina sp. MTP4]|uniref:hypothetical protein n=1 Tax=Methanosarcina sp. MTP4 TaxID=1434100 RepID=UPI0006160204|nr:hypothetical protein [Methanosarcina sp. MTP4]AKB25157.1 hypothetical protein MSMTP_1688 [Methanosarcina sp. MTP4]